MVLKNVPNVTHENDNSHWFTKVPWHLIVQHREGPLLFMTCLNFCCRCIIILSYFGICQQLLLCPTANNYLWTKLPGCHHHHHHSRTGNHTPTRYHWWSYTHPCLVFSVWEYDEQTHFNSSLKSEYNVNDVLFIVLGWMTETIQCLVFSWLLINMQWLMKYECLTSLAYLFEKI